MGNENPQCRCDRCGHAFTIELHQVRRNGIYVDYLQCPGCMARYIAFATDRQLRQDLERLMVSRAAQCTGDAVVNLERTCRTRGAELKQKYAKVFEQWL